MLFARARGRARHPRRARRLGAPLGAGHLPTARPRPRRQRRVAAVAVRQSSSCTAHGRRPRGARDAAVARGRCAGSTTPATAASDRDLLGASLAARHACLGAAAADAPRVDRRAGGALAARSPAAETVARLLSARGAAPSAPAGVDATVRCARRRWCRPTGRRRGVGSPLGAGGARAGGRRAGWPGGRAPAHVRRDGPRGARWRRPRAAAPARRACGACRGRPRCAREPAAAAASCTAAPRVCHAPPGHTAVYARPTRAITLEGAHLRAIARALAERGGRFGAAVAAAALATECGDQEAE